MQLVNIQMMRNRVFPFEISNVVAYGLIESEQNESFLCHLRYGQFNLTELKLVSKKNMVNDLPCIDQVDLCEGCLYGKQVKGSFSTDKAKRATLELIHANI